MTIQIDAVPLSRRFLPVGTLDATSSRFAICTKSKACAGRIVNVFAVGFLNRRYLFHASCHAPIVTTISLLDLEFLGSHPCPVVSSIGAYRMVKQAAVF